MIYTLAQVSVGLSVVSLILMMLLIREVASNRNAIELGFLITGFLFVCIVFNGLANLLILFTPFIEILTL